jgi:putative PIN family toxin of toxin-antitoxin system
MPKSAVALVRRINYLSGSKRAHSRIGYGSNLSPTAIDFVIDARVNLCLSKEIIHEVLGILAQKFSKGPEELSRTAVFLSELGEIIVPRQKLAVLDDEPNNRKLECAVTGHADVIVAGDRAMLNLKTYQQVSVLSLRQFLDEISIPDT